ncbi:TPA: protein tyrosine phosphatase, partial [Klebsiella pneumoniae]|nr:protein tyrosine phosphatase [Klebsiella pneumoniae]
NIAPEARGKTMLLGHWIGMKEIPDPYRKSDEAFESVYQLIEESCQCWADKLGR